MSTSASRSAARGWVAILVFVVAHNVVAAGRDDEMLSQTMARWVKAHPVLVRAGIAVLALHLAEALPDVVDPFAQAMSRLPRWT